MEASVSASQRPAPASSRPLPARAPPGSARPLRSARDAGSSSAPTGSAPTAPLRPRPRLSHGRAIPKQPRRPALTLPRLPARSAPPGLPALSPSSAAAPRCRLLLVLTPSMSDAPSMPAQLRLVPVEARLAEVEESTCRHRKRPVSKLQVCALEGGAQLQNSEAKPYCCCCIKEATDSLLESTSSALNYQDFWCSFESLSVISNFTKVPRRAKSPQSPARAMPCRAAGLELRSPRQVATVAGSSYASPRRPA